MTNTLSTEEAETISLVRGPSKVEGVLKAMVLLGVLGTGFSIFQMSIYLKKGNDLKLDFWQKMRLAGQGFTISTLTAGVFGPMLYDQIMLYSSIRRHVLAQPTLGNGGISSSK